MRGALLRTLYVALFIGLGVGYYFFFGPGPTAAELSLDLPWWRPAGWALRWDGVGGLAALARAGWPASVVPILVFWIPPLGLAALGFSLFRSAPMRSAILALGLSFSLFVVYGYLAQGAVWRFFSWRLPATALGLGTIIAGLALAPSLLRALLAQARPVAAAALLAAFAGVFLLSTEITGTNTSLRANLSPWPVLTLFGFVLAGYCLAALHVAAASGIWLRSRLRGAIGTTTGVVVPALLAAGLCYLIFERPGTLAFLALGASAALYAGFAGAHAGRQPSAAARSAAMRLVAGLLMASFIFVSNRVAISFLDTARNQRSQELIAALGRYRLANGGYPDQLRELVPVFLDEVPDVRMGLIRNEDEVFVYSNFGDSYALEFASVQWVQCVYSPPYTDDNGGPEAEEGWGEPGDVAGGPPLLDGDPDREQLGGSWSCESTPPLLW